MRAHWHEWIRTNKFATLARILQGLVAAGLPCWFTACGNRIWRYPFHNNVTSDRRSDAVIMDWVITLMRMETLWRSRTSFVCDIFICTSVRKHVAFLLLWYACVWIHSYQMRYNVNINIYNAVSICINSVHSYEWFYSPLHAVANKIIRTNAVRIIFSVRTSVHKHIVFLLLWVRTNASEFIRTNSVILVCVHPKL